MMPVPTHLKEIARPLEDVIDETCLRAYLQCPCGGLSFDLLYPGATRERNGEDWPCTLEKEGRVFFLIRAKCSSCGRHHTLVDKDFHGWDGFVCHNEQQAALPRPSLTPWLCRSCSRTSHEVLVEIQTEGRQDFIETVGDRLDPDRWPDAFGWLDLDIICSACRKDTESWVSLETM